MNIPPIQTAINKVFRVIKDIPNEYLSLGEYYILHKIGDSLYFCAHRDCDRSCYISKKTFESCLNNGSIVYTN